MCSSRARVFMRSTNSFILPLARYSPTRYAESFALFTIMDMRSSRIVKDSRGSSHTWLPPIFEAATLTRTTVSKESSGLDSISSNAMRAVIILVIEAMGTAFLLSC